MIYKDSITVLLVEDNDGDYILTREMLKEAQALLQNTVKITLIRAETFKQAIEIIPNEKIDCILLDLTLPDASGVETFYCLRAFTANIPIVIFSGLKDEHTALKAVNSGAQDYLIKGGIDSSLLYKSIRYSIERASVVAEMKHLSEHSARTNKTKTEFIYHFANDTQEILNSLYNLMLESFKVIDDLNKADPKYCQINKINLMMKSLVTTFDFVKDFAHLELESLTLDNKPQNLKELIQRVVEDVVVLDDGNFFDIEYNFDKIFEAQVMIDEQRLKQVVKCFYSKFVLFAQSKDVLRFDVSANEIEENKYQVNFDISIKGREFSNKEKQLIFESTSQSDFSAFKKYGPSGLELAIAARIIALMDGRVKIVSEAKKGTELSFSCVFRKGS